MTPERERELLLAALEILRNRGYDALTMEAVAIEARCSKATLYRLFGSKQKLVAAAMYTVRPTADDIDTGTLRGDLVALAEQASSNFDSNAAIVAAVAYASLSDPVLARSVRSTVIDDQAAHVQTYIDRAVARGELSRQPAAAQHLARLAFGFAITHGLFGHGPDNPVSMTQFTDDVLLPALRNS
jgi:AcrR family transcriptional regulator